MADPQDRGEPGQGVRPNVDVRKLGLADRAEDDWGEPLDAQAQHGANHAVRPERTEPELGQGAKTRRANKDIVSRRS